MKKHINGFTLIELLAVIVVLAVIAIISTPITLNIIKSAEKNTFKDSVYGALKASKISLANQTFEEHPEDELIFNFSTGDNIDKLDLDGKKPENGYIKIDSEGNTEVLINNGKYCAKKSFDDDDITIEKYEESLCENKT